MQKRSRKNGGSVDFIKSDGVVINENRPDKDGSRTRHQKAALVFKRGKLTIAKWDETADWEHRLDGEDIMLSGPLLVYHSALETVDTTAFSRSRHPRTAVAVTEDNVLLIAVDGRHQRASGMSLPELRKILKWLGAVDGINLDGGGSTTLWIDGQTENGVVNYPSDNKQWDHLGERKVANVVLLK
jgi:exopolysaccharide biosynthesis protein